MKAYTPGRRGRTLVGSALCTGLLSGLVALPGHAQSTEPVPEVEPAAEGSELPADARFACQLYQGEFTVMYQPESQPEQAYPWATPGEMGGGWTAERRCYTISDRLESYRPQGLVDLQVGVENGYDIVCATTEQTPGQCQIVFTVPPGQNPVVTRDRVFENLAQADAGSDTTVVNTFTGNGSNILGQLGEILNFPSSGTSADAINLKPFLDTADGGTGSALRPSAQPSRPLNPDNFR
ncbi:COP23 domain-containing protein [Leptolyngbya sp. BC1307]|uniref:COP23 domain-containing protein n=1 Tax=Leptolyngbya sp. BC1307 TaxID=2029589 RepID=UPI000EFAC38E|nr:COP23 domain-containing protein [Leptolyngbya sp. BC1307]